MSEWKNYILGDITQKITDGTHSTVKDSQDGDFYLLSCKNIKNGKVFITNKERRIDNDTLLSLRKRTQLQKNDILLTSVGTIGEVAYVIDSSPKYEFQRSVAIIRPDIEKVFYKYLYYDLKSKKNYLDSNAEGAVQKCLFLGRLKELEIKLPALEEQKAIAEVLSSLDDKIDLLHRQNKTLEELAQTLFRQWFVEEAKDDWEVGVLDEILTVKGGTTPSTKNDEYWNGNICWSTPKDLSSNSNMYLFDTARKITDSGLTKIGSGLLPKGTILLSSRAPVGYLAIAEVPLAINQGYIAILDNKEFSKYFIFLWLKINMEYIISNANGSTFLEISKTVFKSLEITKPPTSLRNKFDEIVVDNFEKIKDNTKQIKTLENMRDTLLPKLMSGEVRVKLNGEKND